MSHDRATPRLAGEFRLELSSERRHLYEVVDLVDSMQRRATTEFEAVLRELNAATVESVPGAQYACVTLVENKDVSSLASTHPYPSLLDEIQREVGEGPCLSAAWDQHTISIGDLSTDMRWPRYRDAAIHRTPVRSVASFRLFNDGTTMAALNLFAEPTYAFNEESLELGLVFAAHTTVAWNMMRRQEQFQSALASRDIIGQAKGILMERFDINAVAAFGLLRKLSQESNTKLVDIAAKLVNLEHPAH
jgi:hypothetical protein